MIRDMIDSQFENVEIAEAVYCSPGAAPNIQTLALMHLIGVGSLGSNACGLEPSQPRAASSLE
jgi:hypothetical protein